MDLIRKLGVGYVVATPVVAGLSTLDVQIGGLNYTGFVWAAMLPIGVFLLAMNRLSNYASPSVFPCWPWFVWCGFVCASLLWCEQVSRRHIQDALQLCMPIVVGLLAAESIRTRAELRLIFTAFGITFVLLALYTMAFVAEFSGKEWIGTHMRAAALATALVGCVLLALFPQRKSLALVGWAACILMTTLTSSRIATLALLAVPMFHPYFQRRFVYQLLAAAIVGVVALILFRTQTFQEHFFHSGEGTVGDLMAGDYSDLGRLDAWSAVWDEAWRRPLLGAGVGEAFLFVPKVWQGMDHVHNDYLRIFFEQGMVGVAIFLAACGWQLLHLRRGIAITHGIVRITFTAAWLGFFVMLISCAASNTLVYTVLFTNPLFVLIGAGYGVATAESRCGQLVRAEMPASPLRYSEYGAT